LRAIEKKLRERIKQLEAEKQALEEDRRKFREHFENRFRWWLKLLGEGKTPSVSFLIESDAKVMATFVRWFW
jgi:predicted nuclease with TOPRIM domain